MSESAKPERAAWSRRGFLSTLGAGPIVAMGGNPVPGELGVNGIPAQVVPSPVLRNDYLFEAGLVYLGTATMGPCSRQVIEATTQAWRTLETNPTAMGYPDPRSTSLGRLARTGRPHAWTPTRLLSYSIQPLGVSL